MKFTAEDVKLIQQELQLLERIEALKEETAKLSKWVSEHSYIAKVFKQITQ